MDKVAGPVALDGRYLLRIPNDDRRRVLFLGADVPQDTPELVASPVGVRGRPHFFDGSRPLESPRKLLPDAKELLEARLNAAATSSICATVKALHGWQAALDATRQTRAVAEARAEHARYRAPQGGSSRRRGAKRSAPPEVPVEELTIRESDCLPYEYEGPPMATMGGGGGCVIA